VTVMLQACKVPVCSGSVNPFDRTLNNLSRSLEYFSVLD
jgi:hypothetical protein